MTTKYTLANGQRYIHRIDDVAVANTAIDRLENGRAKITIVYTFPKTGATPITWSSELAVEDLLDWMGRMDREYGMALMSWTEVTA